MQKRWQHSAAWKKLMQASVSRPQAVLSCASGRIQWVNRMGNNPIEMQNTQTQIQMKHTQNTCSQTYYSNFVFAAKWVSRAVKDLCNNFEKQTQTPGVGI